MRKIDLNDAAFLEVELIRFPLVVQPGREKRAA